MWSHDALWKGLLQVYFADFLELAVPEVAKELRPAKHRILEQESFADLPKGKKALLDLLAEVSSAQGSGGLVLVHTEVEHRFGQPMDSRMERYFFHLRLKYDRPIVPIVLFLKGGQARLAQRHVEHHAAGSLVNRFSYWAVGLSSWRAEDLVNRGPLGLALATCARGDRLPKDEQRFLCMQALLDTKANPAQQELLITAIETYLELNREQTMKYAERVARSQRHVEMQKMELTWAGKLHLKGRKEGLELGRQQGVELGRREGLETSRRMLGMILSQRFGERGGPLADRLGDINDPATLEKVSQRALADASFGEIERLLGDG